MTQYSAVHALHESTPQISPQAPPKGRTLSMLVYHAMSDKTTCKREHFSAAFLPLLVLFNGDVCNAVNGAGNFAQIPVHDAEAQPSVDGLAVPPAVTLQLIDAAAGSVGAALPD